MSACNDSNGHARIRGLLLDYYLTGDPMARDSVLQWADAARLFGPATDGADGMAYLCNLSELLLFSYDPALVDRMGECSEYLFRMPLDLQETSAWVPGLRGYVHCRGDRRAAAYLQPASAAAKSIGKQNFPMVGLLRDLLALTGDAAWKDQADKVIADMESVVDHGLGKPPTDAPPFTWDDFCAYVFGAREPAEHYRAVK
jgi:hypothetical protein